MTKIQNSKFVYDLEERTFQNDKFHTYVLVIWYWNLRFICDLVLVIWNLTKVWCFSKVLVQ
jgi:hypothetical protein